MSIGKSTCCSNPSRATADDCHIHAIDHASAFLPFSAISTDRQPPFTRAPAANRSPKRSVEQERPWLQSCSSTRPHVVRFRPVI
jgi:hypothetical protein